MSSGLDKLERLPIFRLGTPAVDAAMLDELARSLFGIQDYSYKEDDERLTLRGGAKLLDMYRGSGSIWAADESQLWNPELAPQLLEEGEARAVAEELVDKHRLLPKLDNPFSLEFAGFGGTYAAMMEAATHKRTDRRVDVQVNFAVRVAIPTPDGEVAQLPMVGGGGEFSVALGHEGQVIGFNGVWRSAEAGAFDAAVVPREQTDEQFHRLTATLEVRPFDSYLAYYAAPASAKQEFLYPVRVYRASALVDRRLVPLRQIILPATDFGPPLPQPLPMPRREHALRRGAIREKAERRRLATLSPAVRALSSFEAGTSWIGLSGGLAGSQNNAKGFVDGLAAAGWNINFNWGDANAWESDWRRNDDTWVDAADFVFYTGHADMNGWVLSNPDDGSLTFGEVGAAPASPGDLWGQQDLEWIIVAACGPLQDELLAAGGGDVFDRWDGAFDGLHQLMGYGAVTFDNEEEGELVVKYARDGETLINAWFRAAKEVQPSTNGWPAPDGPTIYAGVMYVYKSGTTSPYNDHLWGYGSVAPDPISPDVYVAMWTTT